MPDARPLIIVTGAGRSGTSAVARVLHESGVSLGGPFVATSEINPAGFYEDAALLLLHERLWAELGLDDFERTDRWPWRTTVLAVATAYRDAMREQIAKARGGWKDPRFCLTLEAWLPLLPVAPKVVVCLRSPKSYADSVTTTYGFIDRKTAERQWARQYRRLLDVVRDYHLDAYCVEFDALIEAPEQTVAALGRFVGHELDRSYLERDLRHHRGHVRVQHRRLYDEVLGLSASIPRAHVDVDDSGTYIEEVQALAGRVLTARRDWLEAIGTPQPKISDLQRCGLTPSQAAEVTRAASAGYADLLQEAQTSLQSLEPPPPLEKLHEETTALFDRERLTAAAFVLAASGSPIDQRVLKTALQLWRRFSSDAPFQRRQRARERAYRSALAESDHPASRGE